MISCVTFSRGSAFARLSLALAPALAGFALLPTLAQAQAQAQQSGAALAETVVTANRTPQALADIVGDVSVIEHDTIVRSGANGVGDLLARQPGIEMVRNGGVGNSTSMFIRGAETRFTAVYLDGVRIDSQSTGGAGWESIPLAQIDRIEILRGPAAAVYGSDAIGGVIQLFTKRGEDGVHPYVGLGFGSYNLRRTEAGVSGKSGAFDYSLGASHDESRGFDIQPMSKRKLTDNYTSPDRDGYHSTSGNVKLGWQITPDQRIDASVLANDILARYDTTVSYRSKPPLAFKDDVGSNTLRTGAVNWTARWNDWYSTRVQVTDSRSTYETDPSYYRTETQLRGYLFQNEFRFGPHLVTAAFERREDNLVNPATTSAKLLARDRSQDALSLGYGFVQGPHSLQLHVRHDDDSEFGGKTTGSAAYGYNITPALRASVSAGTAFRAPTLYQRFSEYGLATLQPETSQNVELGLNYAKDGTTAGVVVYRNRVRNLINFASTATGCVSTFGCYSNVGRAVLQGATFTAGQRIGDVTLRASYDLQDPKDATTGNLLARRSKRHGTLGADWNVAGWTFGAEVQASSQRYDDAANTVKLGGYSLLNLSATTQVARDLKLVARIDNVGNKDYQLARLYATAGRSAYVGLKWTPQ